MTPSTAAFLLKGLNLVMLGLEMAPEIRIAFGNVTALVGAMVREERNPTTTEWAELEAFTRLIHERIQGAHPQNVG